MPTSGSVCAGERMALFRYMHLPFALGHCPSPLPFAFTISLLSSCSSTKSCLAVLECNHMQQQAMHAMLITCTCCLSMPCDPALLPLPYCCRDPAVRKQQINVCDSSACHAHALHQSICRNTGPGSTSMCALFDSLVCRQGAWHLLGLLDSFQQRWGLPCTPAGRICCTPLWLEVSMISVCHLSSALQMLFSARLSGFTALKLSLYYTSSSSLPEPV